MIETTAVLVAFGAAAAILVTSTIAALGIIFTPSILSPVDKCGINQKEYQERIKHNNESLYLYAPIGSYPRSFGSRSPKRI
jgi:hypothetical protein